MGKTNKVDYEKAMRDFDQSLGRKPDEPLFKSAVFTDPAGVVDYLKVSREYEHFRILDQSEAIHNEKKQKPAKRI